MAKGDISLVEAGTLPVEKDVTYRVVGVLENGEEIYVSRFNDDYVSIKLVKEVVEE